MALPIWAQQPSINHIYTVVIDAGHGGKDVGAVGRNAREKDLNLAVALKTGQLIQAQHPDIQVVYTRTTDVFLPLQRRADIVNANNADLFICVHTNSAENHSVYGAETFVLGTEKMSKNLDVAMRENAVMKLEADYQTTYQGFDPNSVDSYIMFELMQNQYMDASLRFATFVQNRFVNTAHRSDRGVRQAAFWVLLKSACPSVLVEMGFVSNTTEETYLASTAGQTEIATAIAEAFNDYYKPSIPATPVAPTATPEVPATEKPKAKPVDTTAPAQGDTPVAKPKQEAVYKPTYAIQICAVRSEIPVGDERLKGLTDYGYIVLNGYYKYYTAASNDRAAVNQALPEVRELFPDAFIITLHAPE